MIIKTESPAYQAAGPGGSIVLNATAEFCRTLGDIPTYGLSGNREEDAQELLVNLIKFISLILGLLRSLIIIN